MAVKEALAEPLGTVTDEGTVSLVLLELRVTAVAEEALADRVTVQEDEPAPVMLVGLQATPVRVAGGGVTVNCVVTLPAVMVAFVVVLVWPACAVNVPVDAAAAIVTLAGTVTTALEELVVTVSPPVGAAPDSEMVQVDCPPAATEVGLHDSVDTVGTGLLMVTEPPVADTDIEEPPAVEPIAPVMPIVADADAVSVMLATGPFAIVPAFSPYAMHIAELDVTLQDRLLLAAVNAVPALICTAETRLDGYVNVH